MIWFDGRITDVSSLAISVEDRTFEHGLGLFETLRTHNGAAPLLDWHLERMRRAAEHLGIPLEPDRLPREADVQALVQATIGNRDALVRITSSGGLASKPGSAFVWMRCRELPPPPARPYRVVVGWRASDDGGLSAFKSLNYLRRAAAYQEARDQWEADESLSVDDSGGLVEGSRTNLFAVERQRLLTAGPRADGRQLFVPGIFRRLILAEAATLGLEIELLPGSIPQPRLAAADEVFLCNSVRGILPVERIDPVPGHSESPWTYRAPGPVSQALQAHLDQVLRDPTRRPGAWSPP